MPTDKITAQYQSAKEKYAELDVDTEKVLQQLETISLSLHCWQGDDVGGFEKAASAVSSGGLQATGNYPGKARTPAELRTDLEKALSLIPGTHRVNLHAMYGEFGGKKIDRNQITPENFNGWIEWALKNKVKLDFNATCFGHPKADAGFTLSSKDNVIRKFWVEHVQKCREIAAYMGLKLDGYSVHNLWIPDGAKDLTVDRFGYRSQLKKSLDEIYSKKYRSQELRDAIEGKLFGIGSESFVVGSQEFYLGYALANNLMLCLDMGHFHPTESVADKVSSIFQFSKELLVHVSRGVRWDSDHVVIFNDELRYLTEELVRSQAMDRVHLALDYFDASINRIGAWVIGARATQKALLTALLEPRKLLLEAEESGNGFKRLALLEDLKTMPIGAIWNYYCRKKNTPLDIEWTEEVKKYEKEVLVKRN